MKTIMIKDTVYNSLSKIKGDKSFSELLAELANSSQMEKKALIKRIVGILSDKEANTALKKAKDVRMDTKARSYGPSS